MDDAYLLTNEIIFDSKPIAVPYNYRISYKISQLMLILSLCCARGGCSLAKLHMISIALNSDTAMQRLIVYAKGGVEGVPIIRFDPVVNRALMYAIAEGIVFQQKDGKLKPTKAGRIYVERIMKQDDLMNREKSFLSKISTKITEKKITEIMSNWRYLDASD